MDDKPQDWAERERALRDREFLNSLHQSKPLHMMHLAETMGWVASRDERNSLRYRLARLFRRPEKRGNAQVRRLEEQGSILGYRAVVDAGLLDFRQTVFVQVALRDVSKETRTAFTKAVHGLSAIVTCHMITGDFHYMLKVQTADVSAFQDLLTEEIAQLPGVARTAVIIAMKTVK